MDEKTLSKILHTQEKPAIDPQDMKRTADAAWDVLQETKIRPLRKGLNFPVNRAIAAMFIVTGLFLGLSYTVTQSTRSGSGDASGETNLIGSAQLTQYPAGIRTAVVRMIIGGTKAEELRFNTPEEFSALVQPQHGVFHQNGGGALYQLAPEDMMESGAAGQWFFNMALAIPGVGTDLPELAAYLSGVSRNVCARINSELGIDGIPRAPSGLSDFYTQRMVDGAAPYATPGRTGVLAVEGLAGQAFGCFEDPDSRQNVYYHVLVER